MRVVIADDAVLFREGLARVLQAAGIQVAAQVGDAEQLLVRVRADPPAAVVVDIRMPPTHTREGLDAEELEDLGGPDTSGRSGRGGREGGRSAGGRGGRGGDRVPLREQAQPVRHVLRGDEHAGQEADRPHQDLHGHHPALAAQHEPEEDPQPQHGEAQPQQQADREQ